MAAPVITSTTPSSGFFIGHFLVDVVGENFQVAYDAFDFEYGVGDVDEKFPKVASSSPPTPVPEPAVRMRGELDFGGGKVIPITKIHVTSESTLWFICPRVYTSGNNAPNARSPVHQEVATLRLIQLDDAGADIPGEVAELPGAITLRVPGISRQGPTDYRMVSRIVADKMLLAMRSFVHPRTVTTPHDTGPITPDEVWLPTKLPTVVLTGPSSRDALRNSRAFQYISVSRPDGTALRTQRVEKEDFEFEVLILAETTAQALDLKDNLTNFVLRFQYFDYVLFEGTDIPIPVRSTLMFESRPTVDGVISLLQSSIKQVRARIRLLSVPVGFYGELKHSIHRAFAPLQSRSIIHQVVDKDGNTVPPPSLIEE